MSTLLKYANAHFATMPILVGTAILIRPDSIAPFMFKNAPLPSADTEIVDILLKGFAIRDIYLGISLWAAIATGSRKVIGFCLLGGLGVAAVDGYALHQALGRGLIDHWAFLPVLLVCGVTQAFS